MFVGFIHFRLKLKWLFQFVFYSNSNEKERKKERKKEIKKQRKKDKISNKEYRRKEIRK